MKRNTCKQRADAHLIIAMGVMLTVLLSSCGETPGNSYLTSENASSLIKFQEWELMYINAISWNLESNGFVVAGASSDNDEDSGLYMYDINAPEPLWSTITIGGGNVDFHPDNQVVAVPYYEGIEYFDAITGQKKGQIDHDTRSTGSTCIGRDEIRFSSDGAKIITLSTNWEDITTIINVWDAAANQCLGESTKEVGTAFDFELSRDGQFLAIGFPNALSDEPGVLEPQIHVWSIESRKLTCKINGAPPIAFTLDGNFIAAKNVDNQGDVDLWDAKSCQFLDKFHRQGQKKSPFSMDFSPDGKLLAIGGGETFQIWDVISRKLLFESEKLPNAVKMLAFSPDGRLLLSETDKISVDDKATITLWRVSQ